MKKILLFIQLQHLLCVLLAIGACVSFYFAIQNPFHRTLEGMPRLLDDYADLLDRYQKIFIEGTTIAEKSEQTLFSIANNLECIAGKVKKVGWGMSGFHLKNWHPLQEPGEGITSSGVDIENISNTLKNTATLLNRYQKNIYPQTLNAMALTSQQLRVISKTLQSQQNIQRYFSISIAIFLLIFSLFIWGNAALNLSLIKMIENRKTVL